MANAGRGWATATRRRDRGVDACRLLPLHLLDQLSHDGVLRRGLLPEARSIEVGVSPELAASAGHRPIQPIVRVFLVMLEDEARPALAAELVELTWIVGLDVGVSAPAGELKGE